MAHLTLRTGQPEFCHVCREKMRNVHPSKVGTSTLCGDCHRRAFEKNVAPAAVMNPELVAWVAREARAFGWEAGAADARAEHAKGALSGETLGNALEAFAKVLKGGKASS